jgi:hypothetical protein
LEVNDNNTFSLAVDYQQRLTDLGGTTEAHLFWIGFGVDIENLLKAVLLKHEVLRITRQTGFDSKLPVHKKTFKNYKELKAL